MKRIILHWTAGSYNVSGIDVQHYHYIIDGDGMVVIGLHKPEANLAQPLVSGKYAAHTLNCNTGSIGVALAGMSGAKENGDYGKYPLKKEQFDTLYTVLGDLCLHYDIPVTRKTLLSHAEVQTELRITQKGKWDISVIPHKPELKGATAVGDYIRTRVQQLIDLHTEELKL